MVRKATWAASAYLPESRDERDKPCVDDSKVESDGHRSLWPTLNDQLFAHRGVLPSAATVAKYGEMPDLNKLIDAAALPDKSRGQIEDEIRTAQDRRSLLMHNQIGLSDYGVAQPGDEMRPYPAPRPVIRVSDVTAARGYKGLN
ncbi:hypothetical protein OAO87_02780 [bacterium]|nr:hypothetical protein [bacterium]